MVLLVSPGAEVKIDCMFKAISRKTIEEISISVNRTTDKFGIYRLQIPSVDGIKCAEDSAVVSSCQASLMWSTSSSCNIPGYKTTSDEIAIKSRQANLCIYSLNAMNFRPPKREVTLCGNWKRSSECSFLPASSNLFFLCFLYMFPL